VGRAEPFPAAYRIIYPGPYAVNVPFTNDRRSWVSFALLEVPLPYGQHGADDLLRCMYVCGYRWASEINGLVRRTFTTYYTNVQRTRVSPRTNLPDTFWNIVPPYNVKYPYTLYVLRTTGTEHRAYPSVREVWARMFTKMKEVDGKSIIISADSSVLSFKLFRRRSKLPQGNHFNGRFTTHK